MMEEQVCVFHVCTCECKRRLMHHAGRNTSKYSATTNINFNLFLSLRSVCLKMEAVRDKWKIDEQPDVSNISFDVVKRNNLSAI